jgi:hypothetical protein
MKPSIAFLDSAAARLKSGGKVIALSRELAESSIKIDHIILIRPAHEENRNCIIRFLPRASQQKETGKHYS